MGHRLAAPLGALALLLGAATAEAGTLTSATWVTQINAAPDGGVVSFTVPILGTGTSTSTSVAVTLTVPAFSQSVLVNPSAPVIFASLTLGGAQSLTATPGKAAATQGLREVSSPKSPWHRPRSSRSR